ncbi:unnamed protein product, partial [Brachionus calyciflorus]
VIKIAKESKNINKSSRETGIDRRLISRWLKKEDSIKNTRNKQSRVCANTGQEKSFSSSMENELYDWICEKRLSGSCLSTISIKTKAMEIFKNVYRNIHEETIVSRLLMIGSLHITRFCIVKSPVYATCIK